MHAYYPYSIFLFLNFCSMILNSVLAWWSCEQKSWISKAKEDQSRSKHCQNGLYLTACCSRWFILFFYNIKVMQQSQTLVFCMKTIFDGMHSLGQWSLHFSLWSGTLLKHEFYHPDVFSGDLHDLRGCARCCCTTLWLFLILWVVFFILEVTVCRNLNTLISCGLCLKS